MLIKRTFALCFASLLASAALATTGDGGPELDPLREFLAVSHEDRIAEALDTGATKFLMIGDHTLGLHLASKAQLKIVGAYEKMEVPMTGGKVTGCDHALLLSQAITYTEEYNRKLLVALEAQLADSATKTEPVKK